jgi:hypothetical protein
MAQLSDEKAFVKAQFGDSRTDVIVYVNCHSSLVIEKDIQTSSGRVDSYDLFILDGFFDNILLFMLSGFGNSACDSDPLLSVFPTIKPGRTFSDIFNTLDKNFNDTLPERMEDYGLIRNPFGSYSFLPLIQGEKLTNAFINKYVFIGEDEDDIYIEDKNVQIRVSDLDSVANLLVQKRNIPYFTAVKLVEFAVTVDAGKAGGWDTRIPGGFVDEKRLNDGRIQRISFKEVFFLLYLLGYENPVILDSSCSGNYSSKAPQTERLAARTAAKRVTPFIDVDELLVIDNKGNSNFTSYDKNGFDQKCKEIIDDNQENIHDNQEDIDGNQEYIRIIMDSVPDCTEEIALIALSNENTGSILMAIELARAVLNVMNELKCTEEDAIRYLMASKGLDGSLNVGMAKQYGRMGGGKKIKKTMRRKRYRKKSIRRNMQRSKKSIRRKTK